MIMDLPFILKEIQVELFLYLSFKSPLTVTIKNILHYLLHQYIYEYLVSKLIGSEEEIQNII